MLTPIPIFVCIVSRYSRTVQYLAVGMFNPLLNFTLRDGHRIGISNFYGNWGIGCFLCTRLIPYASVGILSDPITQCINYKSVLNEKEDYVQCDIPNYPSRTYLVRTGDWGMLIPRSLSLESPRPHRVGEVFSTYTRFEMVPRECGGDCQRFVGWIPPRPVSERFSL